MTRNNISIVKLLLERGADPTIRNSQGRTPVAIVRDAKERSYPKEFLDLLSEAELR
jgi:hypothetical protein